MHLLNLDPVLHMAQAADKSGRVLQKALESFHTDQEPHPIPPAVDIAAAWSERQGAQMAQRKGR